MSSYEVGRKLRKYPAAGSGSALDITVVLVLEEEREQGNQIRELPDRDPGPGKTYS